MALELWDSARGNLLGEYASEEAVFGAVTDLLGARGEDFVAGLVLAVERADGASEIVWTGPMFLRQLESAGVGGAVPA